MASLKDDSAVIVVVLCDGRWQMLAVEEVMLLEPWTIAPEVIVVARFPIGANEISWKEELVVSKQLGVLEHVELVHVPLIIEPGMVAVRSWQSSLRIIVGFRVTEGIFLSIPLTREICRHGVEITFERLRASAECEARGWVGGGG